MANIAEQDSLPRRHRAKPPPIDLNGISSAAGPTPNRIQFWPAAQQRVSPEFGLSGPGSPVRLHGEGASPRIPISPLLGEGPVEGGWAGLPAHILELIFAALRDSQGRWPSRKVLFSVCGVCKLWRRVGHTLFFSNVWHNHSDVIVHPSQLFTLSPHPLRLHTSDHLLRCFVHRTASISPGLSPRFGRLWRFALYLGSDHRSLRCGSGTGQSSGGSSCSLGVTGGWAPSASPQLLMLAQQTGRQSYQLLLGSTTAPGPRTGSRSGAKASVGWRSPRPDSSGAGTGADGDEGQSGWRSLQSYVVGSGIGDGQGGSTGGGKGDHSGRAFKDSGVVAVLRSNIRCSHYELIPKSSCPWARRLIAVAGYMSPQGGPPQPLIQLEYRLRVRGIMLPRRMKVQVPVPHSLQRVVHNPLYDFHEHFSAVPSSATPGWATLFGANGGAGGALGGGPAAVMAPPAPGVAGAAGQPLVPFGGGGLPDEGQEGLMDNLEAAMRTEPLLFATMVDAAMVRPSDDDEAAGRAPSAASGRALRRTGSTGGGLGSAFLRGFLSSRFQTRSGDGEIQPAGGTVQWWGPGSPESRRFGAGITLADDAAGGAEDGVGGWATATPPPARAVELQNKAPHWNDALMCWCLNFRGRVKMASVKNFQLMCSADKAERCVMQFGKVEEGIYILDFNPCVLTAAQAFAAALSTFETKYLL